LDIHKIILSLKNSTAIIANNEKGSFDFVPKNSPISNLKVKNAK